MSERKGEECRGRALRADSSYSCRIPLKANKGVSASLVIDNRRIQFNYRVIIGYAHAPTGCCSPIRLFHVGALHMDGVFALWNVLKMVETIDTSTKSLYF
jgi:hypothetical protein